MRRFADLLIIVTAAVFFTVGTALTLVGPLRSAPVPTAIDPIAAQPVQREGGVSLMGMSALLLLVRPRSPGGLARLRSRDDRRRPYDRGAPLAASGPMARPGSTDAERGARPATAVLRNPVLALSLGVFTLLQVLDGVTSIAGGATGLLEGNRLAGTVASSIGPLGGFVAMKLGVVIVMLLAMARLPRALALMACWAGSSLMTLVVMHNLLLLSH